MAYVGAAFSSANADVRAAALRVAVVAAEVAGAVPVRRLLPQGMNPKMKEQVEQALGGEIMATGEARWLAAVGWGVSPCSPVDEKHHAVLLLRSMLAVRALCSSCMWLQPLGAVITQCAA